jgi:hypothetical protein
MNRNFSSIVGILAICFAASALQAPVFYDFTISSGYTLIDAYIIDTEPAEAFAFIAPLMINGRTNFPPGTYGWFINGSAAYNNDLTIIGLCTNATTTVIGVTMPPSVASALISSDGTWADYIAYLSPDGSLPDEATTISNLQSGNSYFLQDGFGYLPATNATLQAYGQLGTVVAFDGAQSIGTFSFSLSPILNITAGAGTVTIQWLTNATGFTLAQSTNLAAGSWSDVTATPTTVNNNYSVTLPMDPTTLFFRLHN